MTLSSTYSGLRVLDLSTNIAGPFAAMILGDLGADVIKIERYPSGDDTRALPPRWGDEATVFMAVNRNKRSVLLDLKSAEGREAVLKLAETADTVVDSFPPGLAKELQLSFDDFRARNPRIVLCSISAFGDGRIGATLPGYDALVQAASGMMSFTGIEDAPAVRLAPSVLDLSTGLWAAMGIMAALTRRERGGTGEHLRLSLIDSAFNLMCHQILAYVATDELPKKLGSGAPSAAPYRVYVAQDGELMIATATDAQFVRLCGALGAADMAVDSRFGSVSDRIRNRDALDAAIGGKIRGASVSYWLETLFRAGISCSQVNNLAEALTMPITSERHLFVDSQELGSKGGLKLLRLPIDPSGSAIRRRPPFLGEHSTAVLRESGFDEELIAKLTCVERGAGR